ncbi:quinol dehydrogenase ferredoxin subunit NapH [Motiliproteus sp. SC1-56]|uniref:quinol dehydrogenase ferredoxin subunit NapH n=1 Tax=Motiliproteus sp. SC1-56 TaxID=2799565 RepID=UPI001F5CFDA7|nr:quinol dehydrogenase ferredoxin subunit NapH [Motiliproteus sp. SC1-56]
MIAMAGRDAIEAKGWLRSHRWLLLRRLTQVAVLGLFLLGPVGGFWILKGNLSASELLQTVPLADPFVTLQSLAAGHPLEASALIGMALVSAFYALVGGRVFCSWVCPVNPVTDLAAWAGRRWSIRPRHTLSRRLRFAVLGLALLLPLLTGMVIWELVNPVSQLHRGLLFGIGAGWLLVIAVFVFDLFYVPRGWCGHLCPMGALYGLIGRASLLRVKATRRRACYDCGDCFAVCPEPHVIKPALKGERRGQGPVILSGDCTNCGRCIDICSVDVFEFGSRFANQMEKQS